LRAWILVKIEIEDQTLLLLVPYEKASWLLFLSSFASVFPGVAVIGAAALTLAIILALGFAAAALAFARVLAFAAVLIFFAALIGFCAGVSLGVVLLGGVLSESVLASNKPCQRRTHKQ
jgi:hypothetical protein